jgi:pyrroline-5-carboxylate reductase
MTQLDGPLLLVGCGKMGGAMLRGWLARDILKHGVAIIEPNPTQVHDLLGVPGIGIYPDARSVDPGLSPAVVVLAVKPQQMDGMIADYRSLAGPRTLFISIAAGKTLAYFARHLGAFTSVVLAMPNTPAAVGRGMTVLTACPAATPEQVALAELLLGAVGDVARVEDEALIDVVTAVSGGGPAYVFLLIEMLAAAGAAEGLPPELAMRLARATVIGSGELARQSSEPASVLRANVTSPGGTTRAALDVLMAPEALPRLFVDAIAAATRRSRELAN